MLAAGWSNHSGFSGSDRHLKLQTSRIQQMYQLTAAAAANPLIKRFKLLSQDTPNHTLVRNSSATSTAGPRNAAEAELDRYLKETAAADSKIISAVDFWQGGQKSYNYISSFTSLR